MKLPVSQYNSGMWPGLQSDGSSDDDDNNDDAVVIGIDFGTTYSGVAWATAGDFNSGQINLITTWPGYGREEGKVPTELVYENDEVVWGYDIPEDAEPIRWFKLLLLRDEDLSPELRRSAYIRQGREKLLEIGKSAVDVIADYLRALSQHILETIENARGESVLEALRFHIVLTVPAIWKGYARQSMREAARKAGLLDSRPAGPTTLAFAPEPEAAAFATLCEPGRTVKKDEVYVICDAGGGTVDLISYQIDSTNRIAMHEIVEGTGGLCGGIFIDEAFEKLCKTRLGSRWDKLSTAGIKEIMKGEWETAIKPQFKPKTRKSEYIVRVPAEAFHMSSCDDTSREPYIKNGRIHFSGEHIQQTFKDSFAKIDKLIDNQVNTAAIKGRSTTGIILVGGLGASPYLSMHLKEKYPGTSILQSRGINPRTAICRGAVYKGFLEPTDTGDGQLQYIDRLMEAPVMVTSTVSRASYGIKFRTKFYSSLHLEEDRVWDQHECEWKANNQMAWYLKKGENVSTKDSKRRSFYELYDYDFGGQFKINLYECEEVEVPSRRTEDVRFLCSIDCKLDIPYSELPDFIKPRSIGIVKKLTYELEMVPSGASMAFSVYVNGKRQGNANVAIQFS